MIFGLAYTYFDTMNGHSKYTKKNNRNRDCTKCRYFLGFISKNYFACKAEIYEDQEQLECHDVYDRDVLKKGACSLFMPVEVKQDDMVCSHITLDRCIEKNDQTVSRQE